MPIAISDIQAGWVYRTLTNQERLVLGWDKDGRVVYSSRGGNVKNPFKNNHTRCSSDRFAEKCETKLRQVNDISSFIKANNAQTVVVG